MTPEQNWQENWKEICTHPDGSINLEAIKCELSNYSIILEEVPKVYCYVTNNKLSKPHTSSDYIIQYFNEELQRSYDEGHKEGYKQGLLDAIEILKDDFYIDKQHCVYGIEAKIKSLCPEAKEEDET